MFLEQYISSKDCIAGLTNYYKQGYSFSKVIHLQIGNNLTNSNLFRRFWNVEN